jgi:hypothetical protein
MPILENLTRKLQAYTTKVLSSHSYVGWVAAKDGAILEGLVDPFTEEG